MKVSVLINNYNYQSYVIDAVESVLHQTVPADEIIVVDDCSTDQSARFLQEAYAEHDQVKLICKTQNEGQLASFHTGFFAASGEIICFLDADDLYYPQYIAEVIRHYKEHPQCDFLFCAAELFGNESRIAQCYEPQYCESGYRDLGYSKAIALYQREWVGHRTSTVSCRRQILEQVFPIPYVEDWRLRADDCVVFGASIAGARKFYLAKPLVKYRVHGDNGHYGQVQKRTPEYLKAYDDSVDRLFAFLRDRFPELDGDKLVETEFRSIPHPSVQEFETVKSILRSANLSRFQRALKLFSARIHFYRHGIR